MSTGKGSGAFCTVEGHYALWTPYSVERNSADKKFNAGAILPDWLMPQANPGTKKGGAREIMPTQDLKVVYLSANAMIRLADAKSTWEGVG